MNYLGHISLSNSIYFIQIGNLLADPLKGKPWSGADESIKLGFIIHREIDKFTDSHESFRKLRKLLFGHYRFYGRVISDLLIDYFLTKKWDSYHNIPLDVFIRQFTDMHKKYSGHLPVKARQIVDYIVNKDILVSYGSPHGISEAIRRIEKRCKRTIPGPHPLDITSSHESIEKLCLSIYHDVQRRIYREFFVPDSSKKCFDRLSEPDN